MSDIEKAISLLQQCLDERPYAAVRVNQIMSCIQEALELLKEQEPAKVVDGRPRCRFECGNCGTEFAFVYNYCPSCGRKVDWDG